MATNVVLVLNCGSSSVKLAVVDPESGERPISGLAERVGTPDASVRLDVDGVRTTSQPADGSHRGVVAQALETCLGWARDHDATITAVGHRVVHGGRKFTDSVVVNDEVLDGLRAVSALAPLHNPANIAGIEAASAELPGVAHVAVFDTAFHADMPARAYRYAVPREWFEDHDVRRYGFHGTSHLYVSQQAAAVLERPVEELRLVTAHLGNGCSVAAVAGGVSVDTSMGLTPLEGLVMGTRSGDLDPGIITYLTSAAGLSADEVLKALNSASGLLGLSASSNDMRTVREKANNGDPLARLALDVFAYRLAKYIASYGVPLGGIDAIVFTGGIGENDTQIRAEVIDLLGWLGVELDPDANLERGSSGRVISRPGPISVLVVPTDEELVIARDALRLSAAASRVGADA